MNETLHLSINGFSLQEFKDDLNDEGKTCYDLLWNSPQGNSLRCGVFIEDDETYANTYREPSNIAPELKAWLLETNRNMPEVYESLVNTSKEPQALINNLLALDSMMPLIEETLEKPRNAFVVLFCAEDYFYLELEEYEGMKDDVGELVRRIGMYDPNIASLHQAHDVKHVLVVNSEEDLQIQAKDFKVVPNQLKGMDELSDFELWNLVKKPSVGKMNYAAGVLYKGAIVGQYDDDGDVPMQWLNEEFSPMVREARQVATDYAKNYPINGSSIDVMFFFSILLMNEVI